MQKLTWQQELKNAITNPATLLNMLAIDPQQHPNLLSHSANFPLLVPPGFVTRMQKNDINDPLLRQVLPINAETKVTPGYSEDPLAEHDISPTPGLLHKYNGRVLILINHDCAINCRFCFRRHSLEQQQKDNLFLPKILNYIANDSSISEVILSGGEPLLLDDKKLTQLINQLAAIKHLKYLRIHSRMPIVIPSRITHEFVQSFTSNRLQPIMVIHCNHPQEIDNHVQTAMQHLKKAGVTLLNQSVLLKNINDSAHILIALSKKLFNMGVLPYYLHLLDKVQGAAHFNVTKKTAQTLMTDVMKNLPGYLVPKLVFEKSDTPYKETVAI